MKRQVGPVELFAYRHSPPGFKPRYTAGAALYWKGRGRRQLKVILE